MVGDKIFSFAEIVKGRDAGVRVTDDYMLYAVDLAMVMTGKNRDDAGKSLRNLSDELFQSAKFTDRQFSSRGGYKTKLVSFEDAIELIMVLPGKVARETRVLFGDIIKRFMAGDKSLIAEIEANAQSTSPVAQMARASLAADVAPDALSLVHKRKLEELDIARQENEIANLKADTEAKKLANRSAELANTVMAQEVACTGMAKIMAGYNGVCQDTVIDERARLIFKDYYLNLAMAPSCSASTGSGQALLTDTTTSPNPSKPISLSQVAHELDLKIQPNNLIAIGMDLKKRYTKRHGKEPAKHDQLCAGRMTKVNSYTESDRDLVEEVLRSHARK